MSRRYRVSLRREDPPARHWYEDPDREPNRKPVYDGPLTTSQHILHLLLTVVTGGLWLPVWIIRAARGNRH